MQTLIIYDEEGYILQTRSGEPKPKEPKGVPFMWVDIPEGKRIKRENGVGVDVSKTPHEVTLEDIPPTELEVLRSDVDNAVLELTTLIGMGDI